MPLGGPSERAWTARANAALDHRIELCETFRTVIKPALVLADRIANVIILLRGEKVVPDADLASLYGVETKALVRSVKVAGSRRMRSRSTVSREEVRRTV